MKPGEDGANEAIIHSVVEDDLDSWLQDMDDPSGQTNGLSVRSNSLPDLKVWEDENSTDLPTFTDLNRLFVQDQKLVREVGGRGEVSAMYGRLSRPKSCTLPLM